MRRAAFVDLMVTEAGFTPADAKSEIERALDTVQLSSEEAKRIIGEVVALDGNPGQHNRLGFTLRTPVGVVCAITPFNSPLNAVLHKIAPALAAGNAVILKPSGYTPLSATKPLPPAAQPGDHRTPICVSSSAFGARCCRRRLPYSLGR